MGGKEKYLEADKLRASGDYKKSLELYTKLAEEGCAVSQCALGDMYSSGRGVEQDYDEALKWYRLSASQDNREAQYWLGYMHEEGLGVDVDIAEALKWYEKSAENGYASLQDMRNEPSTAYDIRTSLCKSPQ